MVWNLKYITKNTFNFGVILRYNGIEIVRPGKKAKLSHSIIEKSSNVPYLDQLEDIRVYEDRDRKLFSLVSRVFSVVHRHYQICNGGISQYYFNEYHKPRPPYRPGDCAIVGIDAQKNFLNGELYDFARVVLTKPELQEYELFLECTNRPCPKSDRGRDSWDNLYFEHDDIFETVIELYAQYVVKLAKTR